MSVCRRARSSAARARASRAAQSEARVSRASSAARDASAWRPASASRSGRSRPWAAAAARRRRAAAALRVAVVGGHALDELAPAPAARAGPRSTPVRRQSRPGAMRSRRSASTAATVDGQLVVAPALLGERGRGAGQRLGGRAVVGLSLVPGLLELAELVAGRGEAAGELGRVAQLGGDAAGALVEHGDGAGVDRRGGREVAAGGARRRVGGVARLVAVPAQLGHLSALVEHGGLAGQLALGCGRCGVLGRSADRAGGAGFERGRTGRRPALGTRRLRARPARPRRARRPARAAASASRCASAGAARRPAGRRPAPPRPSRRSACACASSPARAAMSVSSRTCSASARRCAPRAVSVSRAAAACRRAVGGFVEGHLGHLELEQPGRELVAAVVHAGGRAPGSGSARRARSSSARSACTSVGLARRGRRRRLGPRRARRVGRRWSGPALSSARAACSAAAAAAAAASACGRPLDQPAPAARRARRASSAPAARRIAVRSAVACCTSRSMVWASALSASCSSR